jgi:hypothetical protein
MEALLYRRLKIDLDALLPDVAGMIREIYDMGGRLEPSVYIAILKLGLLKTETFKTKDANMIKMPSTKGERCCTNRPMLIQKLIMALLDYQPFPLLA